MTLSIKTAASGFRGLSDRGTMFRLCATSLEAASKSIVLLKNDGVLPLKKTLAVAVVGLSAASLTAIENNYYCLLHYSGRHGVASVRSLLRTTTSDR